MEIFRKLKLEWGTRLMKYLRCLIIAWLVILMLSSEAALAASARVNSSSAKLYRSSSTAGASVSLSKGTEVTVRSISGSWAKVRLNGVTGYIQCKYLSAASGDARSAAYVNKDTYIYKKAASSSARKAIGVNTKVYVTGVSGSYCKVENESGSVTGYVLKSRLSKSRVSTDSKSVSWKSRVVRMDWFNGGSSVLATGSYGYLYDVDTGITLRIKRMGGHNHADVEPATAADTARLLKIAGGSFSWDAHAVILRAGGKYVACSINTMPHGDQTLSGNNYDGQFCLHMTGSTTHETESVNANHQAAINKAYNWAH